jgi:oligopeptide transport system substrate-binding protein
LQVLRLASVDVDTIDPQKALFPPEVAAVMRVFSGLLTLDANGHPLPEAAAELPSMSADGLLYTFKLRTGLKYSDGQPLTAKHFEYSWKRLCDPSVASEYAPIAYVIVGCEDYNSAELKKINADELKKLRAAVGVRAVDDLTLEFKLRERASYFLAIAASWVGVPAREDMVTQGGDQWTEPATYIGNGPFILKEWAHAVKLVYRANPNYHRGKPPLERIEVSLINDTAVAFVAYLNNELDVINVDPNVLSQAQGDAKLKEQLSFQPGDCTFYLGFNVTRRPFDNVKVRRAFAQAFDKEAYVKNVLKGMGLPAEQFLPPGFPGHYKDLRTLKFDPAAAKKALAEAGYPDSKGLPEIKLSYSASLTAQARAEWFQTQFKANLGVEIRLDPLEAKTYQIALSRNETTPQLFRAGWCEDYPDPQNWYSYVFDSRATISRTGWKNDAFDQMVRAADIEPDAKKRDELYRRAAQILVDEVPVAFHFHDVIAYLVKPWVSGVNITSLDHYFSSTTLMNIRILPH